MKKRTVIICTAISVGLSPESCFAWGKKGHQIITMVGEELLVAESPKTLQKASHLLAMDTNNKFTATDIVSESIWADELRNKSPQGRMVTASWHFVNIDYDGPDIDQGCFDHPAVPIGKTASEGPTPSCIIDKIDQFISELRNPNTEQMERLQAVKFLLHFVADIHQPLHAIHHRDPSTGVPDRGGNCVDVLSGRMKNPINLHAYWDNNLVVRVFGKDNHAAAHSLFAAISQNDKMKWAGGTPSVWARESYDLAKTSAYTGVIDQAPKQTNYLFKNHGKLDNGCGPSKVWRVDLVYNSQAIAVVKEQMAKAAVRLAWVLKENLH